MIETIILPHEEKWTPPASESCDRCGDHPKSQAYTVILDRPLVQREWTFCSLPCLRKWAEPVR